LRKECDRARANGEKVFTMNLVSLFTGSDM